MTDGSIETFFLPREVERHSWSIPASIFNRYRSMLIRNQGRPVFVPIRSIQFLAVLDQREILFVDSQSYAVRGETGGRMILLAWRFEELKERDSLDKPMPCEVVSYERVDLDLQRRLIEDFRKALEVLDERQRSAFTGKNGVNVVPMSPHPDNDRV